MSSNDPKGYYKILKLSHTCTANDIKDSYKRLARIWHPDKNTDDPKAKETFQKILEAYCGKLKSVKR